jgi:hypothetical protein
MKLGNEDQLRQLAQTLPPKQQTLDFIHSNLWRQLPAADRRACRDAIAALLSQLVFATQEKPPHERED